MEAVMDAFEEMWDAAADMTPYDEVDGKAKARADAQPTLAELRRAEDAGLTEVDTTVPGYPAEDHEPDLQKEMDGVKVRRAIVRGKPWGRGCLAEAILPYLPSNYTVLVDTETDSDQGRRLQVMIEGRDVAGWTLDGYVLPRLASGLYFGVEVF